ncbi:VpsP family polysaccharide biosynthesis protein [Agaribacter flavus]|uniref:VpsP family polysaccharide biosynthesis protein n=1 Tax=Agaribacter flavus TaxID=1902781 RepID=A0ABV7FRZ9_9ALTE
MTYSTLKYQLIKIKQLLGIADTRKVWKQSLGSFVLFVSAIGFVNAFRFGGASLDYYFVRNSIELWQKEANIQSVSLFDTAESSVSRAQKLHFSHPLYTDMRGQVIEWGVVANYRSSEYLELAEFMYQKSISMRPSWPVSWASLAMVKWRKGEFDEELLEYLSTASRLGPMKPEVHRVYSEVGLHLYQTNNLMFIQIRDEVINRLILGLRDTASRKSVLDAIARTNSKRTACIWVNQKDAFVYNKVLKCP